MQNPRFRLMPCTFAVLLLAACGGGSDNPTAVSASPAPSVLPGAGGPAANAPDTNPPGANPPAAAAPPAAAGGSTPAGSTSLATGYADIQATCSIGTPMRWAREWTIGYNGGVLRLGVTGETPQTIVLDTPKFTVSPQPDGSAFSGPTQDGRQATLSVDASGKIMGASLQGGTPDRTLRCGVARNDIASVGDETIVLQCTTTDTRTPGQQTPVASAPLSLRTDLSVFPWRYMTTSDPMAPDDSVGRLVGGSGAVVTREPSTDGSLRYSVAIGNRGTGEQASYFDFVDGRLIAMSYGNRRVYSDCKP